jgi:transposase
MSEAPVAGRPFVVEWQHTAEQLALRAGRERVAALVPRWQGLRLLREGKRLQEVATTLGYSYRQVQDWVAWYRIGGMAEVARHRKGGKGRHPEPLTKAQQQALVAESQQGGFATQAQARTWAAKEWGLTLTEAQMARQFRILELRHNLPRPQSSKADPPAQEAFKKGASPSS